MEKNLWEFDLNTLKMMYEKETASLKAALLSGASWEEVSDQRKTVTELAIAFHKKRFSASNPAESSVRDDL